MNAFDPSQHPRGNQSTGHAGQFAAKPQSASEINIVQPDGPGLRAEYARVVADYGSGLSADSADRITRERIEDDTRYIVGQAALDEAYSGVPVERRPQALSALAESNAGQLIDGELQDRATSHALVGLLEQFEAGTVLEVSNCHSDGRYRLHQMARPGDRAWKTPEQLGVTDLRFYQPIRNDTWLAFSGAQPTFREGGVTEQRLVSTGVACTSTTPPPPEQREKIALDLIDQMINQDQFRGYIPAEPTDDLLAHIDQSVYTDEVVDQLHLDSARDLPENLWATWREHAHAKETRS
ncbi:hypothetical protein F8O07_07160 [Pseudoclavibacter sp. CFCC 13796]|uniref:hypothetical protein n=1 Tax=Pseudoclavibacter sp. CFCC 13796 TaxID=2615179 RepID=UPI001300DC17|nr:hypothetical protein [Pseudoclavibacter sp. CFCC 13796]KAB1661676.1 hypothetical protein F8O07_07160 [Pseudoclavibacter sp. CFCC 13796]